MHREYEFAKPGGPEQDRTILRFGQDEQKEKQQFLEVLPESGVPYAYSAEIEPDMIVLGGIFPKPIISAVQRGEDVREKIKEALGREQSQKGVKNQPAYPRPTDTVKNTTYL